MVDLNGEAGILDSSPQREKLIIDTDPGIGEFLHSPVSWCSLSLSPSFFFCPFGTYFVASRPFSYCFIIFCFV